LSDRADVRRITREEIRSSLNSGVQIPTALLRTCATTSPIESSITSALRSVAGVRENSSMACPTIGIACRAAHGRADRGHTARGRRLVHNDSRDEAACNFRQGQRSLAVTGNAWRCL
jgi:hypothetical protein